MRNKKISTEVRISICLLLKARIRTLSALMFKIYRNRPARVSRKKIYSAALVKPRIFLPIVFTSARLFAVYASCQNCTGSGKKKIAPLRAAHGHAPPVPERLRQGIFSSSRHGFAASARNSLLSSRYFGTFLAIYMSGGVLSAKKPTLRCALPVFPPVLCLLRSVRIWI